MRIYTYRHGEISEAEAIEKKKSYQIIPGTATGSLKHSSYIRKGVLVGESIPEAFDSFVSWFDAAIERWENIIKEYKGWQKEALRKKEEWIEKTKENKNGL